MDGNPRTAACLAVGSELLGGARLDSNSLSVTRTLARFGIQVVEKRVVGDSVERVAQAIRELMDRRDVVVVTGGLGPTADDVTREAVASALGRDLIPDPEVETWIRERYRRAGMAMPEICTGMARVVVGSKPLRNVRGSAPGMLIDDHEHLLAVFPGVPWEMEEMLARDLVPEIEARFGGVVRVERTLLIGGLAESEAEERIQHLYDRFDREQVTILASYGVLRLVLTAEGSVEAAGARVDEMEDAFRGVLGDDVAGVDVDGLPVVVLEALRRRGETLAAAESCTGGLLSARITDVPGASDVFIGGVVSYSNDVKERVLGVPATMLIEHGAVSQPVARAMASGVRERLAADWGIGITGIAGPTGGTSDKPVGLVHWAVAGPGGVTAGHRVFPGNRGIVREWSLNVAINHLRLRLIEEATS